MKTFGKEPEMLTVMVQGADPDRIRELMTLSIPEGAEAFGMQFEQLRPEYRTKETYRELFAFAGIRPVYATNYRTGYNGEKTDDQLAAELLEIAECGATLCDMMGDYFDRQPDEMAVHPSPIEKQQELIAQLHQRGAKVLMSSHIFRFTPAERVLEIALEQQRGRGHLQDRRGRFRCGGGAGKPADHYAAERIAENSLSVSQHRAVRTFAAGRGQAWLLHVSVRL